VPEQILLQGISRTPALVVILMDEPSAVALLRARQRPAVFGFDKSTGWMPLKPNPMVELVETGSSEAETSTGSV